MKIKLLSDKATVPTQADKGAAGYDLYAAEEAVIEPQTRKLIKTNITLEIPPSFYGRIAPRSGLAYKNGIDVLAGVIDSSYRGDIGVILYNTDKENSFKVNVGDRIAQIIFEMHGTVDKFDLVQELSETSRQANGYGSSGV